MSTPEKELKHCTACNQMTNHSGEKCLKHTPDTEYARNKLNKTYLRLAYGKSDIQKTKKEVDDILNEIISSRDTHWKEREKEVLKSIIRVAKDPDAVDRIASLRLRELLDLDNLK